MAGTLIVAETKHAEVGALLREVVTSRGARLDEQTSSHTVFEGLGGGGTFARSGYIGTYQPVGEKDVEVRLEVWAAGPRRLFWATVAAQALVLVALFATSAGSVAWFLAAVALWTWLGLAALLYYLTFRGSQALEEELLAAFAARLRAEGLRVEEEEQQMERRIRERLEGEAKEAEVAAREAAEPARPKARKPPRPGRGKPARPPKEGKPRRKAGLFGGKPSGKA